MDLNHNNTMKFLEGINTETLIDKIQHFNSLNIKLLTDDEIKNELMNVLCFNQIYTNYANWSSYKKGQIFYRIRSLGTSAYKNTLQGYQDFWEPPANCVKKAGRLNKEGESLLYVTPENFTTPLKEVPIGENEFVALIKYTATDTVPVAMIGTDMDYKSMGITSSTAIQNSKLLNAFLSNEFSRDVGIGTEYLYKTSEIISKFFFSGPEAMQSGWLYRSVQDKNIVNICFQPDRVHKLIKLDGALILKKERIKNKDELILHSCATLETPNSKIKYYKPHSKEQKEIFPEIPIGK